jgi:hypothetical protein
MKNAAELRKPDALLLCHNSPHLILGEIHFSPLGVPLKVLLQPIAMFS